MPKIKFHEIIIVLLAIVILTNPLWANGEWKYMKNMDVLTWLSYPMSLSGFTPFACIFPMIPYGMRFIEEYNSGYAKMRIIRGSRKSFLRHYICRTLLSGGLTMIVIMGSVMIICILGGIPTRPGRYSDGFYEGTIWEPYLYIGGGKLVLLCKLCLAVLFGEVWSLVSLLVGCIWTNRYAAIVLPFVCYQLLWNLLQGNVWNPVFLLRGDYRFYTSVWEPFLYQGIVLFILILFTLIALRRKSYDL